MSNEVRYRVNEKEAFALSMVSNKLYIDEIGYARYTDTERLVHRTIAYNEIYKRFPDKYPLRFRDYVVHHIDKDKLNNLASNLLILTRAEHEQMHEELYWMTHKHMCRRIPKEAEFSMVVGPMLSTLPESICVAEKPVLSFEEPVLPVFSETGFAKPRPPILLGPCPIEPDTSLPSEIFCSTDDSHEAFCAMPQQERGFILINSDDVCEAPVDQSLISRYNAFIRRGALWLIIYLVVLLLLYYIVGK